MSDLALGAGFSLEDMQALTCVAIGGRSVTTSGILKILSIRQRQSNPCIVEVDFKATGDGVYAFDNDLCCLSLDSTNGSDGTWHILQPIETDSKFIGTEFEVHGERLGTFVFDGCDHVSSFMSERSLYIRLTVVRTGDSLPNWWLPTTVFGAPGGSVIPGLRLPIG